LTYNFKLFCSKSPTVLCNLRFFNELDEEEIDSGKWRDILKNAADETVGILGRNNGNERFDLSVCCDHAGEEYEIQKWDEKAINYSNKRNVQ
jgi:hypothetical protein